MALKRGKKVPVSTWLGRIEGAKEVWNRRKAIVQALKDSLAGRFPTLVAGQAWPREGRDFFDRAAQINVNLNLRAVNHYKAITTAGGFPILRFPNVGAGDEKRATRVGMICERVLAGAEAMAESRSAVGNVCTSGSWILWYGLDQEIVDAERLMGAQTPIGEIVGKAVQGMPVSPLPGMDYLALASTIRDVMATPDQVVALSPEQRNNMLRVAQEADVLADEEAKTPKSVFTLRGEVWVRHSPYGENGTLWDPTAWDIRDIGWASRLIVMPKEIAADFPLFTAKARQSVKPTPFSEGDGHPKIGSGKMTPEEMQQENCAVRVWEIHDKINRRRHFVSEGYDDYMEVTDEHPFLDETGSPLLPNFFPMVVRTPIVSDEQTSERPLGIGLIEAGWPHQIEAIKFHSAHATAAKKSARIIQVPAGLDEDTKTDLALARDCAMIPVDSTAGEKEIAKVLDFGQAPIDYLASEMRATANYGKAVGISLATLTGEPIADTLGQEELAMEGSNITQKDIVSSLESGVAELALGVLTLVRRFYPDEKVAALAGKDFVEPRRDPATGNPIGPSPWAEWKKTSLYGDKIECVFASRARNEELAKRKQKMDFVSLLKQDVDLNGLPKWETEPYLEDIAKDLGLGKLARYEPTSEEKAMIMLTIQSGMAAQQQMGRNGERQAPPGGGDPTGRTAGGGRGVPNIPNAQSRGRAPMTNAHIQGNVARPNTAT